MAADWDYAQLAKQAAEAGGPQALLDSIKEAAKFQGQSRGFLAGFAIAGIVVAGERGYKLWADKRQDRAALGAAAERELVQRLDEAVDVTAGDESQDPPATE